MHRPLPTMNGITPLAISLRINLPIPETQAQHIEPGQPCAGHFRGLRKADRGVVGELSQGRQIAQCCRR